jgi:hypothetical protein
LWHGFAIFTYYLQSFPKRMRFQFLMVLNNVCWFIYKWFISMVFFQSDAQFSQMELEYSMNNCAGTFLNNIIRMRNVSKILQQTLACRKLIFVGTQFHSSSVVLSRFCRYNYDVVNGFTFCGSRSYFKLIFNQHINFKISY